MNFIRRLRSFFASLIQQTPTQTANLTPAPDNINFYFYRILLSISRIFLGAILFTVLEHFVPELREKIPSFYLFIDILMSWLESMSNFIWNIFS